MKTCPRCGSERPYLNQCTKCNTLWCTSCPSPKYEPNKGAISACPECGNGASTPAF